MAASNHVPTGKELRLYCWSMQVMLDTVGAELQVVNNTEKTLQLQEDGKVVLTPDHGREASSEILPINFSGLSKAVKKGDTIFVGQYLFTGSETTSVWLEVFLFQKAAVYKCNMAGKPAVVTRVVDSMTGNLRPTCTEATDVANAVLDGKLLS
ncbi:hypothetical protein C3L33_02545, partial [Rhododendron williamsianum]